MSVEQLALLSVALLMLGTVALRRLALRLAARRMLRSALRHPDPAQRAAAVQVVGSHGLRRHAGALRRLAAQESDPLVLDALADLVRRNQWEPADTPALTELRLWAAAQVADVAHLGRAPHLPRAHGVGAPR